MAERRQGTNGEQVSFDADELAALREMVSDWIQEQLRVPPYPPAFDAVIEKLGLGEESRAMATRLAATEAGGAPMATATAADEAPGVRVLLPKMQ